MILIIKCVQEGIDLNITEQLLSMQDETYKQFHCKLMPTVNPDTVIGVRVPALRKLAKELYGSAEAEAFLSELPHKYYDENNLHVFLIAQIKDYHTCIAAVERFLPYIDNWATCDGLSPKIFKKHLPELLEHIRMWLASEDTYTVRFAIGMLMQFYLDDAFDVQYMDMVAAVKSEEYYVNMMIAWYFATALAKQYDTAVQYLQTQKLDVWTHNKTIQKAIESYRITDEQKRYLKTLKQK